MSDRSGATKSRGREIMKPVSVESVAAIANYEMSAVP